MTRDSQLWADLVLGLCEGLSDDEDLGELLTESNTTAPLVRERPPTKATIEASNLESHRTGRPASRGHCKERCGLTSRFSHWHKLHMYRDLAHRWGQVGLLLPPEPISREVLRQRMQSHIATRL